MAERNCVVFDMMLLNTDTSIEAWATTTHKTCGNYTQKHTQPAWICAIQRHVDNDINSPTSRVAVVGGRQP